MQLALFGDEEDKKTNGNKRRDIIMNKNKKKG